MLTAAKSVVTSVAFSGVLKLRRTNIIRDLSVRNI